MKRLKHRGDKSKFYQTLQKDQIVIIVLFIAVILGQFILPFISINGENITAFEGFLKYRSLHWGFYLAPLILFFTSWGFVLFIFNLRQKQPKYPNLPYGLCFIAIVLDFAMTIPLETFLESQEALLYRTLVPHMVATFFILAFIFVIGLIHSWQALERKKFGYDLSSIVIGSVIIPVSAMVGARIGIGAMIGGAIGGGISWGIIKIVKHSKFSLRGKHVFIACCIGIYLGFAALIYIALPMDSKDLVSPLVNSNILIKEFKKTHELTWNPIENNLDGFQYYYHPFVRDSAAFNALVKSDTHIQIFTVKSDSDFDNFVTGDGYINQYEECQISGEGISKFQCEVTEGGIVVHNPTPGKANYQIIFVTKEEYQTY